MNDSMIDPRDSAWFSNYNEDGTVENLFDQNWYKQGGLGLSNLEKRGKIDFLSLPGGHMQIPLDDFKLLVDKYFIRSKAADMGETMLLRMGNSVSSDSS